MKQLNVHNRCQKLFDKVQLCRVLWGYMQIEKERARDRDLYLVGGKEWGKEKSLRKSLRLNKKDTGTEIEYTKKIYLHFTLQYV